MGCSSISDWPVSFHLLPPLYIYFLWTFLFRWYNKNTSNIFLASFSLLSLHDVYSITSSIPLLIHLRTLCNFTKIYLILASAHTHIYWITLLFIYIFDIIFTKHWKVVILCPQNPPLQWKTSVTPPKTGSYLLGNSSLFRESKCLDSTWSNLPFLL